jgi:hypothetical protein
MSSRLWQSGQALTDDTITLSSVSAMGSSNTDWMTASITNMGAVSGTTYAGPYTINTSNGTSITQNFPPTSAKIQLNGKDADVEVNGWSLVEAVKRIEERLGLFQPNPELESQWEELKQLGEQYRKLEQYIQEKQATFDRLKSMPAPDLD